MSDSNPRGSAPLTGSPGRVSRPHWPWLPTYSQRSSQSSLHSPMNSTTPSTPQSSWDPRSSISSSSSTHPTTVPSNWSSASARQNPSSAMIFAQNQNTTRHWTFTAFEWVVRDVSKLKDFVEGREPSEGRKDSPSEIQTDDFEILKESPMMGDGKFKLEIALTQRVENTSSISLQTLSLYITSLMLDFPHAEYDSSASMMTAIKCQDDRVGERGARADWIWEFWQDQWTFGHDSEVWECPLPPISTLLENGRVRDTDSFVICVQIHCPIGPFFPQQPSAYYVPKDLLEGLEASLDNANTGDVQFVCLERLEQTQPSTLASPNLSSSATLPRSPGSPSFSSSHSPFSSQTTARKRVIYAHSDIISRRSEYFATMLASSFSENTSGLVPGDRKLHTIIVEEADFETVYWLLKWVYGNWLLFKENDDPRIAVDGIGEGWSTRWLNARGGEWDWKTFQKANSNDGSNAGTRDDTRSVTSAESRRSSEGDGLSSNKGKQPFQAGTTPTSSSVRALTGSRSISSPKANPTSTTTARQPNASTSRRPAITTGPVIVPPHSGTKPVPVTLPASTFPNSSHYPISPHAQRQHLHASSVANTIDPHPHPTQAPLPASALSMYQVAHRYAIPALASLALEHLMTTITPQSSFPLLLATSVWDELRSLVEDYVVDKWDEVSVSEEFELCCQEVAAGEEGGESKAGKP